MADILSMLQGGGSSAGADLPPSMPDPEPGGGAPEAGGGGASEVQTLKDMLGLGRQYLDIPTVTEQERAQMESATSVLQKLLAANEKMSEQVTGAQPALRKVLGG